MQKSNLMFKAFTIVELLVVIVIISILALIAFVSYSGISKKANDTSVKSDLSSSNKMLKLYQSEHGFYPYNLDANKCPLDSLSVVDTRYCLKPSTDTAFTYSGGAQSFTLTASKNGSSFQISETGTIADLIPITAIGDITGTTTAIGSVLTSGSITPGAATVSYQWQRTTTVGGSTYTNIPGATTSTYTLTLSDVGKYLKVIATGTGSYSGSQTSNSTVAITDTNWLAVGGQVWAKYNSNVGTRIAGSLDQVNNATLEKYCFNNTDSNCVTYGGLYQWGEAMQYSNTEGAQGICPTYSHIPSDTEWKTLEMQLGMTQVEADKLADYRGTDQATKLKSGGASGLNILLTGYRNDDGSFLSLSATTELWSSTESGINAIRRNIDSSHSTIYHGVDGKAQGVSIRCVSN